MVREIITLNIGQCGLQLGQTVWEQYCAEHEIDANGEREKNKTDDSNFLAFYEETETGTYVSRNLMVDLEPDIIDNVKSSKYSKIFEPKFLLAGKEDANIFSSGHYTIGKEMMPKVNDHLRRLVDKCDNVQGFIMNHSVGGGTGSGLGCLILQTIAVDYRKKCKLGFEVYSDPNHNSRVYDPYNALLTTHWLMDHTEVSVVYDNKKMYEICQKNLKIKRPSHQNMNRLMAKNISSITAALRWEHIRTDSKTGDFQFDLNTLQNDLVPFPRLHFLITSMAPITPKCEHFESMYKLINNSPLVEQLNVAPVINEKIAQFAVSVDTPNCVQMIGTCLEEPNFLLCVDDFDHEEDKYMSICTIYRGEVKEKEANASVNSVETKRKMRFVEWCPKKFNVQVHENNNYAVFEDDDICPSMKSLTMLGNNTLIGRYFAQRISRKFDSMYSKRAYVHHYVADGMVQGELVEAREDLGFFERDFLDVRSSAATDDWYEESWD